MFAFLIFLFMSDLGRRWRYTIKRGFQVTRLANILKASQECLFHFHLNSLLFCINNVCLLMKFKFRQIFIFWRIIFGLNENFTVQIISCKI